MKIYFNEAITYHYLKKKNILIDNVDDRILETLKEIEDKLNDIKMYIFPKLEIKNKKLF